jgi:hypothetical protein
VNFAGLDGGVVAICICVEVVFMVEVVVIADMDADMDLVRGDGPDVLPPSFKRTLPATSGELQAIHSQWCQPDMRCSCKSIVFASTKRSFRNIMLVNRVIHMPYLDVCSLLQVIRRSERPKILKPVSFTYYT